MKKIGIDEFLQLAKTTPVIDVRSPGEYLHARIPGAHSLPLFSDDERNIVGTIYKRQGREEAIKTGLDFFGVKMKIMVEATEKIISDCNSLTNSAGVKGEVSGKKGHNTVLVHCWRGGMRSAGVAWLLDLYGFEVYVLNEGYKAYRNWVLQQFERPYSFKMLGGYTGSGKTDILKELAGKGQAVVDLEGLAHHKGSAFGALGEEPQPTQEMFENELATALNAVCEASGQDAIWLEDESRRIGSVNVPGPLWEAMRHAPLYFLDIPFEERLDYIVKQYGRFEKQELLNAITRIQKRLGGQATKDAISYLNEDDLHACFRILLCYYDKFYAKDIASRSNTYMMPQSENKVVKSASLLFWKASKLVDQPDALFFPVFRMKRIVCNKVNAVENSIALKD